MTFTLSSEIMEIDLSLGRASLMFSPSGEILCFMLGPPMKNIKAWSQLSFKPIVGGKPMGPGTLPEYHRWGLHFPSLIGSLFQAQNHFKVPLVRGDALPACLEAGRYWAHTLNCRILASCDDCSQPVLTEQNSMGGPSHSSRPGSDTISTRPFIQIPRSPHVQDSACCS